MATERETLARVRDDIRGWIQGDADPATMYYTLMMLEQELSGYLRQAEEYDRLAE